MDAVFSVKGAVFGVRDTVFGVCGAVFGSFCKKTLVIGILEEVIGC